VSAERVLEIRGLCCDFGGLRALSELDLDVFRGETLGIIGPNGAGKSVLLNAITRFAEPTRGKIMFDSRDLVKEKRTAIGRAGVARTFQNIRLFKRMTVLENVLVAFPQHVRVPFRSAFTRTASHELDEAYALLDIMRVAALADRSAAALAYGDARRVELARALALRPKLLLLDEPAAGMNESETLALREDIERAKSRVGQLVLVEHDLTLVGARASPHVAQVAGVKVAEGEVEAVLSHPDVVDAYLGGAEEEHG
jgi:branched-chain amino acid transport system ATP-binding protein